MAKTMNINKLIGSTMLVVGTAIGAGILALPLVGAQVGFIYSSIAMIVIAIIAYFANMLILEVNSAFPLHGNSFSSMSHALLGKFGKVLMWVLYLFYLYAIVVAYISGNASLIIHVFSYYLGITFPVWLTSVVFVVVLGFAVFISTEAVDYLNRGLLSLKGVFLIAVLVCLLPYVDVSNLLSSNKAVANHLATALPVFLSALNFALIIPSLSNYLEHDIKAIKCAIVTGLCIITPIYIWWMFVAFGLVPMNGLHSFNQLFHVHGSVGELVTVISFLAHNKYIVLGINAFTNITMTTSFLGVSLALFDFLADGFKMKDTRVGRLKTSLLTYIPPLILALLFSNAFVGALGYVGVFIAVLFFIFPALMVYKLRRQKKLVPTYRAPVKNIFIWGILAFGVIIIVMELINTLIK
jgi:tyrosine-specific transport protein